MIYAMSAQGVNLDTCCSRAIVATPAIGSIKRCEVKKADIGQCYSKKKQEKSYGFHSQPSSSTFVSDIKNLLFITLRKDS